MKENAYNLLGKLGIAYNKFEHPPLLTCDDAEKYRPNCDFLHVKNLFLRNKNESNLYLIILPVIKKISLKDLQEVLHETKLSFANETTLLEKLKVTQGAVSLLNIANLDTPDSIKVVIDSQILEAPAVAFHPNVNTETVVFAGTQISKMLNSVKANWRAIPFNDKTIDQETREI